MGRRLIVVFLLACLPVFSSPLYYRKGIYSLIFQVMEDLGKTKELCHIKEEIRQTHSGTLLNTINTVASGSCEYQSASQAQRNTEYQDYNGILVNFTIRLLGSMEKSAEKKEAEQKFCGKVDKVQDLSGASIVIFIVYACAGFFVSVMVLVPQVRFQLVRRRRGIITQLGISATPSERERSNLPDLPWDNSSKKPNEPAEAPWRSERRSGSPPGKFSAEPVIDDKTVPGMAQIGGRDVLPDAEAEQQKSVEKPDLGHGQATGGSSLAAGGGRSGALKQAGGLRQRAPEVKGLPTSKVAGKPTAPAARARKVQALSPARQAQKAGAPAQKPMSTGTKPASAPGATSATKPGQRPPPAKTLLQQKTEMQQKKKV